MVMNDPDRPTCRWAAIAPIRDCVDVVEIIVYGIMRQSVPPTVMVVVDDGSTDGTGQILDSMAAHHDMLRVLHTKSETRDYSRIPKLLNMALDEARRTPLDYHLKAGGDVFFYVNYVERLIHAMEDGSAPLICHGMLEEDGQRKRATGDGMLMREEWFRDSMGHYPENVTYEDMPRWTAMLEDGIREVPNAACRHLHPVGHGHGFGEWGSGMRAMGYHPYYAIVRCMRERKWNMFWNYITYRERPGTYLSSAPSEFRRRVRKYQSERLRRRMRERLRI